MVALVVFLSIWGAWTATVARAVATNDAIAVEQVWGIMGWFAIVVGDAVWFAAASKAYHLVAESDSIVPEAVDVLMGHRAALSYSLLYVGGAIGFACVAFALLLYIMLATSTKARPAWATACFGEALSRATDVHTRCATLAVLQWVVEVVVLTAIHIASPPSLGDSFRDALGLAIGLTVAVVTGRNAYLVLPAIVSLEAAVLSVVSVVAVLGHVAIFTMFPMFWAAERNVRVALALAVMATTQAAAAGVVWAKRTVARAPLARPSVGQARPLQALL